MNIKRKIIREMSTITRCIAFIRQIEFKKYDLTRGQHAFLTRIIENPGISQEELSYMLRMDKTTTAKAIKKLEKKEYINKVQSTIDRRSWNIYPTELLISIYPSLIEKINNTSKIGFEGFTDEELDMFLKLVTRVRMNIDSEWISTKK